MALTGTIVSAKVVGTPKPGDTLKLEVVYNAEATENEAPWTVSVAAFDGSTLIGYDNTSQLYNSLSNFSVEFTCTIKMPSTSKDIGLALYGHPDTDQKIEDYL